MKILSSNVKGCKSLVKKKAIKEVVCKENLDIVVFQEVKASMNRVLISSLWQSKFKEWILLPSIGRSRVILLI